MKCLWFLKVERSGFTIFAQNLNYVDSKQRLVMIDPEGGEKLMEHRNFQRFSVKSLVTFSNGAVQGQGHLANLSLGGAAVISDVAVKRGSYLTVAISVSGDAHAIEIELAPVRWVKPGSFGVEFWISAASQRRLKHYVDTLDKTSEAA